LTFKLRLVELIQRGELTPTQARERYGIQGAETVMRWLKQFGHADWKAASLAAKGSQPMSEPSKLPPEQRIVELESQLKVARQKAEFFEAMVKVMKQNQGETSAKKLAGRSSRKSSSKG
jgi:transposase-like protein